MAVIWLVERRLGPPALNELPVGAEYSVETPGEYPLNVWQLNSSRGERGWIIGAGPFQVLHLEDEYCGYAHDSTGASLPHWAWFMLFATLSAAHAIQRVRNRRQRRLAVGGCTACGYDLHAIPDRCPECGAVPKRIVA